MALPFAFIVLPALMGLSFSLKPIDREAADRLRRRVRIEIAVLIVVGVCAFWLFGTSP
jgi:hypothetical protein